jgi:hypothetical protein
MSLEELALIGLSLLPVLYAAVRRLYLERAK